MNLARPRSRPAAFMAALLGAMACGGDGGPTQPTIVPKSVTISGGNNQTGPVGGALAAPLQVIVIGTRTTATGAVDVPMQGVTVTWQVTAGGGTVTPTTSVTDANGTASASLTLGTTPGRNSVSASVTGLVPAAFEATAAPGAPASILRASGDSQTAVPGAALSAPIVVRVTDQFGNAVSPTTVTYAATSGGGAVNPSQALTNAEGQAQATWTLGATIGTQVATATVGALSPVAFTATALDPCLAATPYTLGSSVTGNLSNLDCELADGSFIDFFSFTAPSPSPQSFRFELTSTSFDAFLILLEGMVTSAAVVAFNDDGAGGTNSAIRVLMRPGPYVVGANSFSGGETGAYTLSSTTVPSDVAGCVEVWVTRGIQTVQEVRTTDCLDPSGPFYSDEFFIFLQQGQTVTITQTSTAFDAFLQLFDPDGNLVADDDDSGGGTNARIVFTPAVTDFYIIDAATFLANATGIYTLIIQ